MTRIAIFASGSGSNAESIMAYFNNHDTVKVVAVFSNRKNAGVLVRAANFNIPTIVFSKKEFFESELITDQLKLLKIDLVVLAGFLLFVPSSITDNFVTINIHPSLLPKYGGEGMYGLNVHQAVKSAGEKFSGMTIHYVNQQYDDGEIIFQEEVKLDVQDTAEDIAAKVLVLEHKNYPRVIEELAAKSDKF